MAKKHAKRNNNKFPNYLFPAAGKVLKGLAFVLVIVIVITIMDSIGQSFYPKITVDAYNATGRISPNLYGYSVSSEFKYDASLVEKAREDQVESFRLTAPFDAGKRMLVKVDNGVYSVLESDNVAYEYGQEYDIEIVAEGALFKVYVDGQKIFETQDSAFGNGKIGLFSSYNQEIYFDDVVIMDSSENVIFSDNFDNGVSPLWNENDIPSWHDNGSWENVDGQYRHQGQQSLALKEVGEAGWSNYIVKATMKSTATNPYERGFMGLVFRHQDPLSSYRFIWQSQYPHPYSSNNPWEVEDFPGQIRTAQEMGVTPNVVVNLRGTPEEAARLVHELNIEKKMGVKYFELGNEIWAYGDSHMTAEAYAEQIKAYATAMKAVDPSIKVGATLLIGFSHWDIPVIERAASSIDFIILHHYLPTEGGSHPSNQQMLASSYSYGNHYLSSYGNGEVGLVEQAKRVIREYAPEEANRMEYLLTEYNTFDGEKGKNLAFGLATAELLGSSGKDQIQMAEFHAFGRSDSHWRNYTDSNKSRPVALAISLFSEHFGDISLPVQLENVPSYRVNQLYSMPTMNDAPYLSSFASRSSDDRKLYVAVINKHEIAEMNTELDLRNADINPKAKVYTLSGYSLNSTNESSEDVTVSETTIYNARDNFSYSFKPHSVTILEFDISLKQPQQIEVTPPTLPQATEPAPPENNNVIKPETTNVGGPLNTDTAQIGDTQIVAGAQAGGNPHVKTFDRNGTPTGLSFLGFNKNFRGGVDVALGDINGDGHQDIVTGAGPGGGPHIRVFDHTGKEILNFFPFHPNFRGGISVATGDVDGDGKDEIAVTQKSKGQAWTKVYKADKNRTVVGTFNAYGNVECGGDVAMGDIDKDGQDEIIVGAGKGGGPLVRVFEPNGQLKPMQFFAFHPKYRGGISVAAGDTDGDGKAEIVASQSGQEEAWVKVYRYNNKRTVLGEWRAFGRFPVGANVGTADLDHDGQDEVIVAASRGGGPQVLGFEANGKPTALNFFVFDKGFRGGVSVAGK